VRRYFARKLITYGITFIAAVTIDWVIPHLMPGDPIKTLLASIQIQDERTYNAIYNSIAKGFRATCRFGSSTTISGSRFSTATLASAS